MSVYRCVFFLNGNQAISFVAEQDESLAESYIKETFKVEKVEISQVDLNKKMIYTEILQVC